MNRLHFWLSIPFILFIYSLSAQNPTTVPEISSVLSSSGSNANESVSLSFSVGLISQVLVVSKEGSMAQNKGMQAIEKEENSANADSSSEEAVEITLYPNPFVDRIHLSMNDYNFGDGNYSYVIFDGVGNTTNSGVIDQYNQQITMRSVNQGIYFMNIYHNGNEIKSIKLLKKNL